MLAFLKRQRVEIEDWLRYHSFIRRAISRIKLLSNRGARANDSQGIARSIARLCSAARLADGVLEAKIQQQIVEQVRRLDSHRLDWDEFVPHFRDGQLHKAAILKPFINAQERGVLFISFEREWVKLLSLENLQEFAHRYTIVVAPSSSPHNLVNYAFPAAYPEPIFTLISNPHDLDVLPYVSPRLKVLPLYASNWVNPEWYQPVPKAEREYDLIMVASWGKVKRHHVLFSALRSMPRGMRILLVGQDQEGRSAETIRALASWYGVQDRITILSNQPYREVTKWFCQARASVVLSKREGSCVVVTESMFADTPVAILRDAELGSRVFINDETGRFLDEATLARDLTDFVLNADLYQSRAWAERNISCFRSTHTLNDALKQAALASGQTWTQDIAPLHWAPDPGLALPADRVRLAAERDEIIQRFGLEIGPPPVQ